MLAGLGQDSLSGLGSITAALLPGVSSPPGIGFNGGSPTLGSAAGTGGSQSNGPVLLGGSGSGTGSSSSGSSSSAPNGPVLLSQYTGGSNAGTQGSGTNNGGTLSGSDLWLLYGAGLGAGSSSSGASGGSSSNLLTLLSQYQEGSNVGGQGNGTVGTLSNAELWRLYWSGAGTGSSSSGSDEGSLADDPAISAQYTGGSGGGRITPLVYNPESDGPPVFHSGVWTGDDGSVQFVQTADTGSPNAGTDPPNRPTWDDVKDWYPGPRLQFELEAELGLYDSSDEESKPKDQGTGEGDTSQSDGKSRARSWWGIRGWFLGDDPIDDGGVPQSESEPKPRTLWQWFIGDDPIKGSLWKQGPSNVLRRGDYLTYNNDKSAIESLEDGGKYTKELVDGAVRDGALAVVGGAIGRSLGAQNASKPPIWTSTKDRTAIQNAFYHFQKHRGEFPEYPNAMQYAKGARDFVTTPPTGTLTKLRPSGDVLFYNPSTNTFAVRNADGSLRTMFRPPNGINYWNQQ
jgi:hypothetical protein